MWNNASQTKGAKLTHVYRSTPDQHRQHKWAALVWRGWLTSSLIIGQMPIPTLRNGTHPLQWANYQSMPLWSQQEMTSGIHVIWSSCQRKSVLHQIQCKHQLKSRRRETVHDQSCQTTPQCQVLHHIHQVMWSCFYFFYMWIFFLLVLDHSSWVVRHLLISFRKLQSMARTLPSREFRWSRSHAEDRETESFSTRNSLWLPLTFLNRTSVGEDTFLSNVKVDSQAGVEKGEIMEKNQERQNHWYLQRRSTMQSDERTR